MKHYLKRKELEKGNGADKKAESNKGAKTCYSNFQ